ncbi:unnamed protein product [Moneuplotes crassus]|uniref:Uncharacterized protein n=1 Tax=Euplotes crassus TaxID=5936 RepID=A0AAD1XV68_EUPCR|nr:unnamed protein product [Moneuplotes crassus]
MNICKRITNSLKNLLQILFLVFPKIAWMSRSVIRSVQSLGYRIRELWIYSIINILSNYKNFIKFSPL